MRDTCGIHVSSVVIKIHAGHMRDTCGIHVGYMRDTCRIHISGVGGMFRCHHHRQSATPLGGAKARVDSECESEWMPLNAEHAIDGVNEEEAICGGLITKVSPKKRVRRPKPIGSRARYFHAGG